MSKNFLQLNYSKSVVLIFTTCTPSSARINNLSSSLGALSNNLRKEARNLGVVFYSELTFDVQVTQKNVDVQSCAVLFCSTEATNENKVIPFFGRFGKSHLRFYFFQT